MNWDCTIQEELEHHPALLALLKGILEEHWECTVTYRVVHLGGSDHPDLDEYKNFVWTEAPKLHGSMERKINPLYGGTNHDE